MKINWANNYDDTNFNQAIGDTRVFNMFIRAWNERLATLSNYLPAFEDCSQSSFPILLSRAAGYLVPFTPFPEARDKDIINSANFLSAFGAAYTFEASAKFVSLDGLNLTYSNLDIVRLIPGLIVKVKNYYGKIISVNLTTKIIVLDRPFDNQNVPLVGDTIYFRGMIFDNSISPLGWWALIVDVLDKVGYFVKNQEADGSTPNPNTFFVDKPSITNWGEEPNYFDVSTKPASWVGSLRSYGPAGMNSRFTRKFWREIQLQDDYTLDLQNNRIKDDRGAFVFKCKLIDNHTLSGPFLLKGKNGFENIKPTLGMKARLVQSNFRDNPAFKYYVFGHTFKYDGTNWVEDPTEVPDLLETGGTPQQGDILGPWILNSLKRMIDDLAWTYILPLASLYNSASGLIPFFTVDSTAVAGLKDAPEGATVVEIFKLETGTFHSGDRVNIIGAPNWLTAVNGNRLTLGRPLPGRLSSFEDTLSNSNVIVAYGNFTHADLDEPDETRWKRTLKIKNLSSTLRAGMLVYANGNYIGTLQSFTATAITLDNFSRKVITGKLFFTETVRTLMALTLPAFDPGFNWMMNFTNIPFHFYYNPSLLVPHIGQLEPDCEFLYAHDRVHAASPAGVWGPYPIASGHHGGEYIFGPGPESRNFAREYDYYSATNNVRDDQVVAMFQDQIDARPDLFNLIPSKIPQYTFGYLGTDHVNNATLFVDDGLAPEDKPYVAYSHRLNFVDGMIVCRWDVPGGFTYTKTRNVDE